MVITAAERIKINKEKQRLKRNKNSKKSYHNTKPAYKIANAIINKRPLSEEALWRRNQRKRKQARVEKIQEQTKERVRKFRLKQNDKMNKEELIVNAVFSNRTTKHRAVSRLLKSLPKTPTKRKAVISAYLDRKSPTIDSIVLMKKLPSPENLDDFKMSESVLSDMKNAIQSVKGKRSNDARASINIICASVSGTNVKKQKFQKKLSKKLGLPVRRMSGGNAIRTKILSDENSSWTATCRKTRSDKNSEEDRQAAYSFWINPKNSRPIGNKNDTKRTRIGPKMYSRHMIHILEKTQTEVFLDFKREYPEIKMCQRTFERCKPFYVQSIRPKDRNTCCCRYHIEARSLFKSCMDFRRKIIRDNDSEEIPVFDHINDLIQATLCERENDSPNMKCLNRECENCGLHLLRLQNEETDVSENAPKVQWTRYEYIKINIKNNKEVRKLCLVKKETCPGEMFSYFKDLMSTFPSHQFRANWQSNQLKHLVENLAPNNCICVHDFSENFSCTEKDEIQTSYFQKTEVTIHVTIIYRHAILEYDGVDSTVEHPCIITEHLLTISPDLTHDNQFAYEVQNIVSEYLKSISYETEVMHEFTDGCQTQYKSRHCMGSISNVHSKLGYTKIIRNYFETSHGKGPQDAAGGLIKNMADMAILRGTEIIQSAKDLYKFAQKRLQQPQNGGSCKRRIFRYIEKVPREETVKYKPVPRNRCIHQIMSTNKPSELLIRDLSCYSCDQCSEGDFENCSNPVVGVTRKRTMEKENDNVLADEVTDNDVPIKELIQPNAIVALYTDDHNYDYYLMKITSEPVILKRNTKDGWGITHQRGSEMIKGYYFEQLQNQPLKFRLIKNIFAYAPVLSVKQILISTSDNDNLELSESDHLDILDATIN